jgi:hypothetical protein
MIVRRHIRFNSAQETGAAGSYGARAVRGALVRASIDRVLISNGTLTSAD